MSMRSEAPRVVIVGAAGHVGRAAVQALVDRRVPLLRVVRRPDAHPLPTQALDLTQALPPLRRGDALINATAPCERFGRRLLDGCLAAGAAYLDAALGQAWIAEALARATPDGPAVLAGQGMDGAPAADLVRRGMTALPDATRARVTCHVEPPWITPGTLRSYVDLGTRAPLFTLRSGVRAPMSPGDVTWPTPHGVAVSIPSAEAALLEGTWTGDLDVGFVVHPVAATLLPPLVRGLLRVAGRTRLVPAFVDGLARAVPWAPELSRQRHHIEVRLEGPGGVWIGTEDGPDAYRTSGERLARLAAALLGVTDPDLPRREDQPPESTAS